MIDFNIGWGTKGYRHFRTINIIPYTRLCIEPRPFPDVDGVGRSIAFDYVTHNLNITIKFRV